MLKRLHNIVLKIHKTYCSPPFWGRVVGEAVTSYFTVLSILSMHLRFCPMSGCT